MPLVVVDRQTHLVPMTRLLPLVVALSAAGTAIPAWMPWAVALWHLPDLVIKWLDVRDRWHRQRQ